MKGVIMGRGLIADRDIEYVLEQTDIVELISSYLVLKKAGREYVGVCPFHSDSNPSFAVNREKGVYFCRGCNASGNVLTFLNKMEGLEFREAVERLAEDLGYQLTYTDGGLDRTKQKWRYRLLSCCKMARDYFAYNLKEVQEAVSARNYLVSRGVSGDTSSAFGIGYCPRDGVVPFLKSKGYNQKEIEASGLNHWYFPGKLMFPICDHRGRPVSFGARRLDEATEPKYLNGANTEIYKKDQCLWGYDVARQAIVRSEEVFVVEGYMDVLAMCENGFWNTVGALGTSFGENQYAQLARNAERIYLAFDGDRAGIEAMVRCLDHWKKHGKSVYAVSFPEEHDPASYLKKEGLESLVELCHSSSSLLDFVVDYGLDMLNPQDGQETMQAVESVARLLLRFTAVEYGPVFREQLAKVTSRLGVSREEVLAAIGRLSPEAKKKPGPQGQLDYVGKLKTMVEEEAIRLLLTDPENLIENVFVFGYETPDEGFFADEGFRQVVDVLKKEAYIEDEAIRSRFDLIVRKAIGSLDDDLRDRVVSIIMRDHPPSPKETFSRLGKLFFGRRLKKAQAELEAINGDLEPIKYLKKLEEVSDLTKLFRDPKL